MVIGFTIGPLNLVLKIQNMLKLPYSLNKRSFPHPNASPGQD